MNQMEQIAIGSGIFHGKPRTRRMQWPVESDH
jgi:hypothetical protein